jgi:gliding motility-associated-like protein
MVEICDNALDDDGDGLIDLNDSDCSCLQENPESLIPNPSFEEQNCCPAGRSELNCAVGWIQASEPTTDYIHTCGFPGWEGIDPPKPFPDGNGIVGFRDGRTIQGRPELNWKEYLGACLTSPLKAGIEYSFEFDVGLVSFERSPPIFVTFFGSTDCEYLPFGVGDESFGCPTNGPNWTLLGSDRVSGKGWVKGYINVTPEEDIYAMAIGPSCTQITNSINTYYFFDNLVLAETRLFPKKIFEQGSSCSKGFEILVEAEPGATYQWYKDGVAIVGETSTSYNPEQIEGEYRVMQYLDGQCNLSEPYIFRNIEDYTSISESICEDDVLQFGDKLLSIEGRYVDTLETVDGCDSILFLDLRVIGDTQDSVYERIFPGDEVKIQDFSFFEEGEYDLILKSQEGCDSLVFLDLDYYKVYIPNSFSPNEDGVNDLFEIFIEEPNVVINSVSIFNRWGSRVYYSVWGIEEENRFWDGRTGNEELGQGVYTYMIEFKVGNDYTKVIKGDVSIVL